MNQRLRFKSCLTPSGVRWNMLKHAFNQCSFALIQQVDWNRRHILYDAIFMLFLPLIFCLQGLFASMPTPPSNTVQTIILYICGVIWMLACLGGLLGIFSKCPKLQVASTHMGRLLFLAFCIMQVGALWFLVPPSIASNFAAGILCVAVIVTHIFCWVQVELISISLMICCIISCEVIRTCHLNCRIQLKTVKADECYYSIRCKY
jgi:hypothetical protein